MDFGLTELQQTVRRETLALAKTFGLDYWREHDRDEAYPWEFVKAFADAGWLGSDAGPEDRDFRPHGRQPALQMKRLGHLLAALAMALHEGANDFAVRAFDKVSNTTDAAISITRDSQAPAVHINLPADGARLNAATVIVSRTASTACCAPTMARANR